MANLKLGQRIKYSACMYRSKRSTGLQWPTLKLREPKEGIIVGKRTVYEGYTDGGYMDEPLHFVPTRHISVYLVASNLAGFVHVSPEDLEAVITLPPEFGYGDGDMSDAVKAFGEGFERLAHRGEQHNG